MLNILFLAGNYKNTIALDFYYYLERAVSRIANCRWAGPGYKAFKHNESVDTTVRRVMPDADWVVYYKFMVQRNRTPLHIPPKEKRRYRIGVYTGDLHRQPHRNIAHLNNSGYDAALMAYTLCPRTSQATGGKMDPFFYREHLKIPYFPLTPTVDPTVFKPTYGKKKWDVVFLAAQNSVHYPLRWRINNEITQLAHKNGWRMPRMKHPGGLSLNRQKSEFLKAGYFVGAKYAEVVAQSKTFIFGTSKYKYPLMKFAEAMACRTCILADIPLGNEEVGYIPYKNFVPINMKNWGHKLKYYIRHDEEREKIAQAGYETYLMHHQMAVRARQLVNFLEKHRVRG